MKLTYLLQYIPTLEHFLSGWDNNVYTCRLLPPPYFFLFLSFFLFYSMSVYYSFLFFFSLFFLTTAERTEGVSSYRKDRCRSFSELFTRFGPFFGRRVVIGHLHVFLWIKHGKRGIKEGIKEKEKKDSKKNRKWSGSLPNNPSTRNVSINPSTKFFFAQ